MQATKEYIFINYSNFHLYRFENVTVELAALLLIIRKNKNIVNKQDFFLPSNR